MLSELIPKIAGFEQKNYSYHHRCSSAGTERCLRGQCYHALGIEPRPFPDRFCVTLDDSSWHEQLSADFLRKSAYRLHSEQMKVSPFQINGVDVTGSIDGIITDLQSIDYLYEHKAISHYSFEAYEAGKLFPYDYITQCCCYILGLEKVTGKYLPGLLLVKNKNTSRYLEYHIEYDNQTDIAKIKLFTMVYENELGALKEKKEFFMENVINNSKHRFEQIDEYKARKSLPPRPYTIDSWQCDYCRWGEWCWRGYEQELADRKEQVDMKEFTEKVGHRQDIQDQLTALGKEKDDITDELKNYMATNKIKTGIAGQYIVELKSYMSSTLNKELIAPELIEKATIRKPAEKISVKKFKEAKTKNGGKK